MLPAPTDGGLAMSVPRRTPNSHAPAGPVPDFLRHRYETSTHRVICLRSVPKTSGIGAVEALTPSTAGRAGLAQRALPRRAGRPLGPHRPRHLPTRRRVDRRLGSDRGRHAPPRRYDLPGLRTHAPRPDRRDPRRWTSPSPAGRGHRPAQARLRGTTSTGPHFRSDATRSRSRDRIRQSESNSPERSIADTFRLRYEVGYELARDALREWLRRGGKPARLIEIATRLPREKSPVLQTLAMLA